jgi:hypothetical protein
VGKARAPEETTPVKQQVAGLVSPAAVFLNFLVVSWKLQPAAPHRSAMLLHALVAGVGLRQQWHEISCSLRQSCSRR